MTDAMTVPAPKPRTWMNITAVVGAVVGLVIPLVGLPVLVGSIVLGALGVRAASRGDADYRGLGLAGIALGIAFLTLWAVLIVSYGSAMAEF